MNLIVWELGNIALFTQNRKVVLKGETPGGFLTLKRFLMMIATILIIATLTFFLMHAIPGSPFDEE